MDRRAILCRILMLLYCYLEVARLAKGQLLCSRLTVANLGSTTAFSDYGLLSRSLVAGRTHHPPVPVKINNHKILCDATGMRRETSSYVSVLVQFQCNFSGSTAILANCNGITNITRQYHYRCSDSNVWVDESFETENPNATFHTELADHCRSCHDPREHPTEPIDQNTHCRRKTYNCDQLSYEKGPFGRKS